MTALFVKQHSEAIAKALDGMEQFFIDEVSYDGFTESVVNGVCEIANLLLQAEPSIQHEVVLDSRNLGDFLYQVKHLTQYLREMGDFFAEHKEEIMNLENK